MDYSKWIPATVRKLRGDKPMREVADSADISISYWSDIEAGRTVPTIATLHAMLRACGATLVLDFTMATTTERDWLYVRTADITSIAELVNSILDEYTQETD